MHTQSQNVSVTDPSVALQELVEFKGQMLTPNDPGYDQARAVWNGMIDKRPAFIARCTNSNDIIQALKFDREKNLAISVKGSSHNVAGNAVAEGGLMIDLSPMKKIQIDKATRTVSAEPGVLWRELDNATMQHGLATTGGTVSDTGIAGLTLGGGLGWLMGKHGLACDNLISAEIITPSGELIKVDEKNHPDLFWAIRGGGGNFGIVSLFSYQLHEVSQTVMAGMLFYPMDQALEVFRFYREYVRKSPDELMSYSGFLVTPDGMPVTFILPAWMGEPDQAEKYLAPLREFGPPIADLISEISYTQLQSILDAAAPAGIRRYWKSGYFAELSDELIQIYLKHLADRPSPLSAVLFYHIKGAATRTDPSATAFRHRKDQWDSDIISQWIDAADDEKNINWTRNFWKAIEPFSEGVYVNHLDADDNSRIRNAYGENYSRLQEVKSKYDPENFFRLNNNILPSTQG